MLLRKINAGISLFITVLLLDHAIFHAVWMLSMGSVPQSGDFLSWVLFGFMMLHALLCIVHGVKDHKEKKQQEGNAYAKPNVETVMQRVTGVLLIVFTILHVLGTVGILQPPKFVHAVLPPLFFALALLHVAVSGSKALITLGIGNAKLIKVVDVFVKILCVVTLVADVIGFYMYLC